MIAEVIVDLSSESIDKIFDYKSIEGLQRGQLVLVPFGNKQIEGFVVNIKEHTDVPEGKLKAVNSILRNEPVIKEEMFALADFMKKEYHLRMVDILRLFLPSEMRGGRVREKIKNFVILNDEYKDAEKKVDIRKNAHQQHNLLCYLRANPVADYTKVCDTFSRGAVIALEEKGVLKICEQVVDRRPKVYDTKGKTINLTAEQQQTLNAILNKKNGKFLVHGVTGSGKTEIYMRIIEDCIARGKTAIMLVPEISLTGQVLSNFTNRFGDNVAILHSGLSSGERYDEWQRIFSKKANIVVGVRSAIFAPVENIGAIIIDEEHDNSYVSESNPRYNTHEVAEFRANYNDCSFVLGSATPSIDTFYRAQKGELTLLTMKNRANNKALPKIHIVDMCAELSRGNSSFFSYKFQEELQRCIADGNQAIVFINRRGYSSFMRCVDCGYVAKCTDCDVSLVLHKEDNQLKCHFCGKRFKVLTRCPTCGSEKIKQGAIGTQRVVEELHKAFPNVPIFRMDNDTTKTKNAHMEILKKFGECKPAILVGTQMVAKGHDFSDVSFVGIIDADLSLHFSDFRSNERTFQLITQVAGRCGRAQKEGTVVLQTFSPKHFVYKKAIENNYDAFYSNEINLRQTTNFPPFSKIVRLLFVGGDELRVKEYLAKIYFKLKEILKPYGSDIYFVEAMNSPVKRIQSKFRYQILMRYKDELHEELIQKIYHLVDENKDARVSLFVEINQQNLS